MVAGTVVVVVTGFAAEVVMGTVVEVTAVDDEVITGTASPTHAVITKTAATDNRRYMPTKRKPRDYGSK